MQGTGGLASDYIKETVYGRVPKAGRGTVQGCRNVVALAQELEVPRRLLYRWRARLEGAVAPVVVRPPGLEDENRQLKRLLAERSLEADFSKVACKKESTAQ